RIRRRCVQPASIPTIKRSIQDRLIPPISNGKKRMCTVPELCGVNPKQGAYENDQEIIARSSRLAVDIERCRCCSGAGGMRRRARWPVAASQPGLRYE